MIFSQLQSFSILRPRTFNAEIARVKIDWTFSNILPRIPQKQRELSTGVVWQHGKSIRLAILVSEAPTPRIVSLTVLVYREILVVSRRVACCISIPSCHGLCLLVAHTIRSKLSRKGSEVVCGILARYICEDQQLVSLFLLVGYRHWHQASTWREFQGIPSVCDLESSSKMHDDASESMETDS